jgi:hypothetical protein
MKVNRQRAWFELSLVAHHRTPLGTDVVKTPPTRSSASTPIRSDFQSTPSASEFSCQNVVAATNPAKMDGTKTRAVSVLVADGPRNGRMIVLSIVVRSRLDHFASFIKLHPLNSSFGKNCPVMDADRRATCVDAKQNEFEIGEAIQCGTPIKKKHTFPNQAVLMRVAQNPRYERRFENDFFGVVVKNAI